MHQSLIAAIGAAQPVIPVLTIEEAEVAPDLARAMVGGGLPAFEVTLRTPAALEAIRRIVAEVPEAIVGAGTVRSPADMRAAAAAGAKFAVSPGASERLAGAAADADLPWLPGVATASEIMWLVESGWVLQKFFPAAAAGGPAAIAAFAGPFPEVAFCPTGGIGIAGARDYLVLDNVFCVGGSWVAPRHLVAAHDWPRLEALAFAASGLRGIEPRSAEPRSVDLAPAGQPA